ncbi:MAG: glycosyltransferase family 4 protein [Rhodospirillaceae bacterium]|nr:glycosyltransferase family 4 protein [Rhodospirillales bacterium]
MKVLVNAISARMGGIVTYTRNLQTSFSEREVDAEFAVSARFPQDGPAFSHLAASDLRPAARLVWEQLFWRRIVARRKPDILFSSANFGLFNAPVPQVLLVREGGLFDPFYLANVAPQQGVKQALQRSIRRRVIIASARHADRVLTPSQSTANSLLLWAPDLESKITVTPYGTRAEQFRPAEGSRRVWRADGILKLLYVSVYYPHKQPGLVCRAAEALQDSGVAARATITMELTETKDFKGGAHDGKLMARAHANGLLDCGRKSYDSLPDLYRNHDVFVFPSISETFGHPMAEALSSGIPCVVADTPVNREICGDAALYFEPLSLASLLGCLRQLDTEPGLRDTLVERGRDRVLQFFTWPQHVDRLLAVFDDIMRIRKG